jgi:hydrogenase maturation protease
MPQERITVMGLGNPLMRDEGIGVRVAEVLMDGFVFPDHVTVIDAGTMGMSILNLFQDADYMLVVDAIDGTGEAPGTVVRLDPADIAPNQVLHSLHDIRFVDVLQAAELMGANVVGECVAVQVEDMSQMSIGLTPAVEAAVPATVAAVLSILAEHGVEPTAREGSTADAQVLAALRTFEDMPGREEQR